MATVFESYFKLELAIRQAAFTERLISRADPAAPGPIASSAAAIAARLADDPAFTATLSDHELADLNWARAGGSLANPDDTWLGGRPSFRLAQLGQGDGAPVARISRSSQTCWGK